MIDAVFISDLHLHPEDKQIQARFNDFLAWASGSVKTVYILGDFFHAWAGDDSLNHWSRRIALQLSSLKDQGVSLFYMHGNRDFLLGNDFAKLARWHVLPDPSLIYFGNDKILLAHGDRYCIRDTAHQRFRLLTRNKVFSSLFLRLSLPYRERLVNKVRSISQTHQKKLEQMDVVSSALTKQMIKYKVDCIIHGHTHRPGLFLHYQLGQEFKSYVLSDWDDKPILLCYDSAKGFYFNRM